MMVLVGKARTETQLYQFNWFQRRYLPHDGKKIKLHKEITMGTCEKWEQNCEAEQ